MTGLLVFLGAVYLFLGLWTYASARMADPCDPPLPRHVAILAAVSWPLIALMGLVILILERSKR
ncbi:hypothetical protein [Cellulosimicrobium sp. TH-20]|uniref:hypothetical protein n=1 Tax=Cellulosimicrobium sp. TH-20 TaxID=1980001 RepID=UPI0011A549F0|nr:hypothetical protein [Cellulosimicrobium sp. TH-20]